ncbi:hypothetical protein [Protofrankia symbiont of Coriaria ruscifolia]|uniref:hypothetical protein n=1 Tax=Protofrankia symbiont of Coriaria ruscifolia TaxID=1306542 RepID=UPI00104128B8|nr:hypothetical protein [Protofrankia symbiont of Coriaria ruscifolia]
MATDELLEGVIASVMEMADRNPGAREFIEAGLARAAPDVALALPAIEDRAWRRRNERTGTVPDGL